MSPDTSPLILAGQGDTVSLPGAITDYHFSASGTQLHMTNGAYTTMVNVGGDLTLSTSTGSATVTLDFSAGGVIKIGGEVVGAGFDPMAAITHYTVSSTDSQWTYGSGVVHAIPSFTAGALGTGDLIDYTSALSIGGLAGTATASQASINQTTGVATFAAGSGTTLADALADVAASLSKAGDHAGAMAFFQVNGTGNENLFISDGTPGLTSTDVVLSLAGISSINSIDLANGNLTVLG